jgi:histone acetyltransferase (RNA polymerase elongator complex component)
MPAKHFTIPVFIPMEACPFQCIYCDQEKISGHQKLPSKAEIEKSIQTHLSTIPAGSMVQVGFFGGTFTGLSIEMQKHYLQIVKPFIENGSIKSIRLSTRPDFISEEILNVLKIHHVETIELGAQSMDDEVLQRSGRGHKAEVIHKAARLIRSCGFRLGLQMMIGLPGDTPEKALFTANEFVRLGADDVRIYPTLVIKSTPLEKLFLNGKFAPLSLDEAVKQTAAIVPVFEQAGVNIIRIGLHPSDGLMDKTDLVAGPFHVSFRELVMTEIWNEKLQSIENREKCRELILKVAHGQINFAVGYGAKNKNMLLQKFSKVRFYPDENLQNRAFHADYR